MTTLEVPVSGEDHVQGPESAQATLVEYGDYECPHCRRAYAIVRRVQNHFGTRLRFVFRNFPLREVHPNAEFAAEVAEFAGAKGKFWEMNGLMFENQSRLGGPLFSELTHALHLSKVELTEALEKREYRDRVQADLIGGTRSGVNGTPTFFINGYRHDAPFEFEDLVSAIEGSTGKARGAGRA